MRVALFMWITFINLYTMTQVSLDEKKIWKAVLAEMEVNFSGTNYTMWLSKTTAQNLTQDSLDVICPNSFARERVEKLYKPFLEESVGKITKSKIELNFKVGNVEGPPSKNKAAGAPDAPLFQQFTTSDNLKVNPADHGLNPAYTFENYLMGNTNRLAYAIASSIADDPGKLHNPFFIYAGVGLGKTHLIQAIGNKVLRDRPNLKVIYCTGEQFTNELIEGLQRGKSKGKYSSDVFRKKYRSADVLIIDDIQFIAGKEATQEEFFHTFNDLYMSQKQIVLASDRNPEEFKNIEERLTSRFKSGIMADIQQPDYELRTAILRHKRDKNADSMNNDVLDFIAENITTNIRELEGAYNQVLTYAKATGEDLTLDTARLALGNIVQDKRSKPVNLNSILKAVCNYYSVTQAEVKGKRRNKEVVIPRHIAMYLIHDLTETPYLSIGEFLGGRDHTTIMHGVSKVETEIRSDVKMKQDVMNIKQFIYQN